MHTNAPVSKLSDELSRYGLDRRVRLNGLDPRRIEVVRHEQPACSASPFPEDQGRLFVLCGGPVLYSWSEAGGSGDQRFALRVGVAVRLRQEGSDTFLELCRTA